MSDRDWRKPLLTSMAILNLVCWIALAGVAGLLLSDRVDMGVETLLREGHATAVAVWERQAHLVFPVVDVYPPAATVASSPATRAVLPGALTVLSSLPDRSDPSPMPLPTASTGPTSGNPTNPVTRPSGAASTAPAAPAAASSQPRPTATPPASYTAASATPPRPMVALGSPTALPVVPDVASSPTQALRTAPLLLANPPFGDLSSLNAEMDRSAPGRPVQIRYQEAALNREIVAVLANNPALPYRDVVVDLQRDRVVITGKVNVLGLSVDAAVHGTLSAHDCQPWLEVDSVSVASVVTPGFVKAQVAGMVQDAMAWYPADYPLCIEQIVLEETKASIYGTRR